MTIRVDSIENLTEDIAALLHITPSKLIYDIHSLAFNTMDNFGYQYIASNKPDQIRNVYLCHITRKADASLIDTLFPLDKLLTSENPFSTFLNAHDVYFEERDNNILLLYKGNIVNWEETDNRRFNRESFRSRLTEDFCVNGYQFLYNIRKAPHADHYMRGPEFLQNLDCLLGTELSTNYRQSTSACVAMCTVPVEKIVFDETDREHSFTEQYIYSALRCIQEHYFSHMKYGNNPGLRALDDYCVKVERWIPEGELPWEG